MNSERVIKLPSEPVTEAMLLHVVDAYADVLTSGKWGRGQINKTVITRMVEDIVSFSPNMIDYEAEPATTVEMSTSFCAERARDLDGAAVYAIRHTDVSIVPFHQMEPLVLEKIVQQNNGEEGALSDYFEGATVESLIENSQLESKALDGADDLETSFQRTGTTSYLIDEDGEVVNYNYVHSYYHDDTPLFAQGYEHAAYQQPGVPVRIMDKGVNRLIDHHPFNLKELTRKRIRQETRDLDAQWQHIELLDELGHETAMGGGDHFEHNRRALALIALNAQGIATINRLLRK